MTEKRFCYNPYKNDFIKCSDSHAIALCNKGKQKDFDKYIRGIINNNVLYLRLYYPYDDIGELTITKLNQASWVLLKDNIKYILIVIKKKYNISIKETKYNFINDMLQGVNLANV